MKDINEYEAIHNLNPANDKLGKDRDFKENTNRYLNWLSDKCKELEKRISILEKVL